MKAKQSISEFAKGGFLRVYDSLPRSVTEPVDCVRRRPYWRKAGAIFVHVPKAAGTSINEEIYGRSLGHMKAAMIQKYSPQEFETLFTFAVVRNPWDRAVSAYRFIKQRGTVLKGVANQAQYEIPAFRSFDAFLNEWLALKELAKMDYVFQPQHLFTSLDGTCLNFIGKTENMAEVEKTLSEKLSREIKLKTLNKSDREPDYRKFYQSTTSRDIVAKVYAGDISLFNYEF